MGEARRRKLAGLPPRALQGRSVTIGVPQTFFLHADGSVYLPRRGQRALRVTNPAVVDAVKRTAAAEDARMAEAEPEPAKKPARKRAPKKAAPDAA